MKVSRHLAVDLGAESGRVMLGTLGEDRLVLEEIHRFPNAAIEQNGSLYWNLSALEKEIARGISAAAQHGDPIASLSVDSWAVDYVLLDKKGAPTDRCHAYRDPRTQESSRQFLKRIAFPEIYRETGIQFLPFNTLFQFAADRGTNRESMGNVRFLTIADYFNGRWSGVEVIEESMASTTQIYNPRTRDWSGKLRQVLELPESFFPAIVPSGTILGRLRGGLAGLPALAETAVIASCSHDTGAAVAAVPFSGESDAAYLSSGTWSLLGAELDVPLMTDAAREAGFTNEIGLGGSVRLLKNIPGLWLVQECRRAWEQTGQIFSYDELFLLAKKAGPSCARLALADARFFSPGAIPEKILRYCEETSQPLPVTPGEFVRLILESLADAYAQTLRQLESITGLHFGTLHIIGGGSRNQLLNQITADAAGVVVEAGPAEATGIGNILMQALALSRLDSHAHLRQVVRASFPPKIFQPRNSIRPKSQLPS